MKKIINDYILITSFVICMIIFTGCQKKQREELQIDYFASRANYQGIQQGWYGKLLKDKFNITMNIIAPNVKGGGDLLYKSRLASGNVGDIVLTSLDKQKECVESDVLLDLTPYLKKTKYLKQYMDRIERINQYVSGDGKLYIIPIRMSTEPVTQPNLYGDKPNVASYIPWDYYVELGCPELENDQDLLDMLELMQKNHPVTEDGKKVYAFSLFKDWENEYMSLAARIVETHGVNTETDSYFWNYKKDEPERLMENQGAYFKALELYYEANKRGLLDPGSGVQSYEEFSKKVESKQVLYLWYAFMVGYYNKLGDSDGYAYIVVPEEYGGGSYKDGFCQANDSILDEKNVNPNTGEPYFAWNWTTTRAWNQGETEKKWTLHFGEESPAKYLEEQDRLKVIAGSDYIRPKESVELSNIRQKCSNIIKEYSWKMIFAENDKKFMQYWHDCRALLYGSGYEQEEAKDLEYLNQIQKHRKMILEEYSTNTDSDYSNE